MGKSTINIYKWSFSIAMLVITRGYLKSGFSQGVMVVMVDGHPMVLPESKLTTAPHREAGGSLETAALEPAVKFHPENSGAVDGLIMLDLRYLYVYRKWRNREFFPLNMVIFRSELLVYQRVNLEKQTRLLDDSGLTWHLNLSCAPQKTLGFTHKQKALCSASVRFNSMSLDSDKPIWNHQSLIV